MIRHGPLGEQKGDMGSLSAMPPVAMCHSQLGFETLAESLGLEGT